MSMVTAMDGIGDVNHVDTVHDNISEEYKQAMEKAMENKKEKETIVEEVETPVEVTKEKMVMTKEEMKASGLQQLPVDENGNPIGPMDIWLQFDTISVGSGERRATFDLAKLLAGIEKLADVTMIREDSNNEDSTKGE